MLKHSVRALALVGIFAVGFGSAAATAAPVTTPTTKAPVVAAPTTKAPVIVAPATKGPAAAASSVKKMKPVRLGNFCKKVLVGKTGMDAKGARLHCVKNAKGQPVWTA